MAATSPERVPFAHRWYRTPTHPRVLWLVAVTTLCIFGLIGRLFYLQALKGPEFLKRAQENQMRGVPLMAARGTIYDRQNRILATNAIAYSLLFYPARVSEQALPGVLTQLGTHLKIPVSDLQRRLQFRTNGDPIYLAHNLPPETLALLLENRAKIPGFEITTSLNRSYPEGTLVPHILGHVGQVTAEELEKEAYKDYYPGVMIGKGGLEKRLETQLKGTDGRQFFTLNPKTRKREFLKDQPAIPGQSIRLTLDKELQRHCQQLLRQRNYRGAIVVMDVQDGSILAQVSEPGYDLNMFTRGLTQAEWNKLQQANTHPFMNRALSPYPPGSIFKMITTLAALGENYLTPSQTFISRGFLNVGGHIFHDWNRSGFGTVNIYNALAHSIDTVFYELSLKMGILPIKRYGEMFLLNQTTGIESAAESPGLLPDQAWKRKTLGQAWLPGDTVNSSIGQGFVQMTPLQAAMMTALIATRGHTPLPHLLEGPSRIAPTSSELATIPSAHWQIIQRGMEEAVSYGTAKALRVPGHMVAGKTGTAETSPGKPTHAWVVAYAPARAPRYAVSVFLEHGGSGGGKAAPIGQRVLDFLLNPQPSNKS